jgi:basic amino acid/polyamine antiporter, APA family
MLLRKLGLVDASLIVVGGIIGTGIFMNPSVVARSVGTGPLTLMAWGFGGAIALLGGYVFSELARLCPRSGGFYAYLRDAYHPSVAFAYGWSILTVSQSGGIAAAAITFAFYLASVTGWHAASWPVAIGTILILSAVNCLGVRPGSSLQNALTALNILTLVAVSIAGLALPSHVATAATLVSAGTASPISGFARAMIPVLYAYTGWQTASFMTAELRDPARTLSRGLIVGVTAVAVIYLVVNAACIKSLGMHGLETTTTPVSDVVTTTLGPLGGRAASLVIAFAVLGCVSNQILTSPRVYFQMAVDGLFHKAIAYVHPLTRTPIVAIGLQAGISALLALTGRYDQILAYVTCIDFIFFGLGAIALLRIAQHRLPRQIAIAVLFCIISFGVAINAFITSPLAATAGFAIVFLSVPIFYAFHRSSSPASGVDLYGA